MPKQKQEIYAILKQDHDEVTELFHRVREAKDDAATDLFLQIKHKLVPHARAEEAEFYQPLLAQQKRVADKVRESIEEHLMADALIAEIEALTPQEPEWRAKVNVLADVVGHHIDEEEGELFPLARQILSEREARDIADRFTSAREGVEREMSRTEQRGAA